MESSGNKKDNGKFECLHTGNHNSPSQNMFVAGDRIVVVTSHNCSKCGHVFTNVNTIELNKIGIHVSQFAVPQMQVTNIKK